MKSIEIKNILIVITGLLCLICVGTSVARNELIGKTAPDFTLKSDQGETIRY